MPDPTHAPDHAAAQPNAQTDAGSPPHRYNAAVAGEIEPRWQRHWADTGVYRQPNPGEPGFDASKPKFYCLDMFPYPSGAGLHVGHPEGYTASDIICRYKKMNGFNVLHPMGWDAFGLPAEQYAISTGNHPDGFTRSTIDNFRKQLQRFGFSYDWSREFGTIDPDYYGWTQWIFLQIYGSWFDPESGELGRARPIADLVELFETGERPPRFNPDAAEIDPAERDGDPGPWPSLDAETRRRVIDSWRLAYVDEGIVNWCPKLGTALANEEVIDGRSERGDFPVVRKPLSQWKFRITAYAERLLADLPKLDWPESTRTQQAEWIGRSEGAEIDFPIQGPEHKAQPALRVYTTRPDTIFGATYMVVAPEHPLVAHAIAAGLAGAEVSDYVETARSRADVERQEAKIKTGVPLGVSCVNPATGRAIPVWVADYVLMGYGTGAIMAVPAHDERDHEFATAFDLPIRDVVLPTALAAVARYAHQMTAEETRDEAAGDAPGRWLEIAADLAGYVTSNDTEPAGFDDAIEAVRSGRAETQHTPAPRQRYIGDPVMDAIGASGLRRGTVRLTWLEFFESVGVSTPEDLRRVFGRGGYTAVAGPFTSKGVAANSANDAVSLDGMGVDDAKRAIIEHLRDTGAGRPRRNYRLRDWLFSRQRYWGEPFPIVWDSDGNHYPIDPGRLPLTLPDLADYAPEESEDPRPLLAKADAWMRTTAGEAGVASLPPETRLTREANTMPGWAGSCWYYLRFTDAHDDERFASRTAERYWMLSARQGARPEDAERHGTFQPHLHKLGGVDLYIGGAEHAVLHLLYARFWHKVLFDLGEVSTPEPFQKLFHQGMITSYAYQRADKSLVPIDQVENTGTADAPAYTETATNEPVQQITAKMSKSLKNVVNPDEIIAEYGADTFRLYEMYMGPLDATKPWNTRDIIGLHRFMQRAWRAVIDERTGEPTVLAPGAPPDPELEKLLHRTIDKVGRDIEQLAMNTAIAALINFVNAASRGENEPGRLTREQAGVFARVLAPFAPHAAEELFSRLGFEGPVVTQDWPQVDERLLIDDEIELPVQINGKLRARLRLAAAATEAQAVAAARADERVAQQLEGKTVRKIIFVPGRMLNIVAK